MKATDYIVKVLIENNVTDLFGYPGGVICHFMDSVKKYSEKIKIHVNYHEQGASFAACGYAQASGRLGAVYATSGPGATNLLTGVANAYFDSIPVIFFTGQVDTYARKGELDIRQRGFQETDIISMAKPVTKFCVQVESADELPLVLAKAINIAISGRPGPVLVDLPADVQRADISDEAMMRTDEGNPQQVKCEKCDNAVQTICDAVKNSKRPCFLAGAGVMQSGTEEAFRKLTEKLNIPLIVSMPAISLLQYDHPLQFGFVGANGHRCANFILSKSDLIVTFGSRLDLKQVGNRREEFVPNAKLIRVDIDSGELSYKVRSDEVQIVADLTSLVPMLLEKSEDVALASAEWLAVCRELKDNLYSYDYESYHNMIAKISELVPQTATVVTDCGQSEVWVAQAYKLKQGQKMLTTSGLGAMGYSLPASIGAHYGLHKPVVSFNGDGGFQMNIQELQFLAREKLPIKLVVLNNHALGMIRHFQEMNFDKNYIITTKDTGYTVPDISKIAKAYGLGYYSAETIDELEEIAWEDMQPAIIEVKIPIDTYLYPKFGSSKDFADFEPLLPRDRYEYFKSL